MFLILMGPPGAGKGTQAKRIAGRLNACHVSTGDLFRIAVSQGTTLGKKAEEYMTRGELVPDDVVVGIVKERLALPDCAGDVVLDGFPRTVAQAEALEAILEELGMKIDAVISLEVPEEVLVERAIGRRVCGSCGASYHMVFDPPPPGGRCTCGAELRQRKDDTEETVSNRVRVYERETQPLLGFYGKRGYLRRVDGTGTIDDVSYAIVKALGTVEV
jgi:adenylate kinase